MIDLARVTALLAAGLLAGCFGGKSVDDRCNEPAEYQASAELPGIQVPEGLKAPGQVTSYTLPPGPVRDVPDAACLARPPAYFRTEPAPVPDPAPAAGPAAGP